MTALRTCLLALSLFGVAATASAQPTYKLDVRQGLDPDATLKLDGVQIVRTAVANDPGFRLQWHFRKNGKTVASPPARGELQVETPVQEAGVYTVVLELFHPAYKGGVDRKGEFKPVSNVLTFFLDPPAKPGDKVRLVLLEIAGPTPPKQ